MVEAATEFAKAGYDEDDILTLGTVASMYTNIADEEVSTAEAAEFLISQMKAFNIEAENAQSIIDMVNEVSNNFAVSSADIAENLGKSSAVMSNAGNSLAEMIALLTAGTEITRDASKVANGLKSITLNLQGMTEEGEEDLELMSTMEDLFDKLGLSVYDSNGELKNTYNLLSDLASVYDELTASEKSYVTQTIAGKYQAQNLSAILSNWATAEEALAAAQDSSGSAMEENNRVMESVQGHLSKLRSEWEKLSTSLLSSDAVNAVLSLGTAFLKLANTGVGTLIIKAGLLSGTIALVSTALTSISKKMIYMASKTTVSSLAIKEQRAELTKYYIELMLASGAVDGLTEAEIKNAAAKRVLALSDEQVTAELISQYAATMKINQGFKVLLKNGLANLKSFFVSTPGKITIVIAAIYAIYKAIKWVAEYSEKKLEKANEALSETKDKIEELNNELEENKNRIKEIQDLGDLASLTDEKELQELTEKNKLLEQQLNYYEKIKEEQEETARKASAQVLNKYLGYSGRTVTLSGELKTATGNTPYFNKSSGFSAGDTQSELKKSVEDTRKISSLQDEIDLYNELNAIENRTESQEDALKASKEALEAQMEKYQKGLENENLTEEDRLKLLEQYNKVLKVIDPTQYKIDMLNTILGQDTDAVKEFNTALKQLASKGMSITEEEFNELFGDDAFGGIYEQLEEAGLGLDDVIANFVELDDTIESNMATLDTYLTHLKSIDETWSGLNSVIEEFNNYGGLSADTIQKILENDWGEYLQFANGELTLNTDLLAQNAEQVKQKALALIDEREQEELLALAQKAVAAQEKSSVENTESVVNSSKSKAFAAWNEGDALIRKAKANKAANDVEQGKDIDLTTFNWKDSGYEDEYNEIVAKYANLRNIYGSYSYNAGASSGTSSSSSSSSSSKEWWEERLDNLKEQFNYNKLTIQEYINALSTLLGQVSEGTDAWDEINEELQKQRLSQVEDDYDRGVISLEEYVSKLKELIKAYKEGTEAWNELADKIKSGLQEIAETQKDDLETAADAAMDLIEEEVERLESLRDAEEKRYDDLISAKEKANDETEREIELARLQEALENAKKEKTKRVFKEGIGWVYEADASAIAEAQEALDEFLNEQEIEDLEAERDAALDAIDEQIDALKEYKESWSDVADDYEKAQERITLAQTLGTEAENNLLADRITYLEQYRDAYLKTMQEIEDLENKTAAQVVGSTASSSSVSTTTAESTSPSLSAGSYVSVKPGTKWYADSYGGGSSGTASAGTIRYVNNGGSHPYNIDGLGWVKKSDIVGYNDGGIVDYTGLAMLHGTQSKPEYILNNDQMRNVLSNLTRPQFSSNFSTNNNSNYNYNFGSIELPNVTNAKQFVTELKSLVNITKHQ